MKFAVLAVALSLAPFSYGQSPEVRMYSPTDSTLQVRQAIPAGYTATLTVYDSCDPGATSLGSSDAIPVTHKIKDPISIEIKPPLAPGSSVCVSTHFVVSDGKSPAKSDTHSKLTKPSTTSEQPDGSSPCNDVGFNDCHWGYTVIGGLEQATLASQNSQTGGFVDLFVHGPLYQPYGAIWLRTRFLGAPVSSDTKNIVTTATDPSGSVSADTLSSVGNAVDYMIGYERDFNVARPFTYGPIIGFGATTPLSAQNATVAYAVPSFGSNECTQLLARFGAGSHYAPPLPGSATVTTTTTVGAGAPTTSTGPMLCSVQPGATSTSSTTSGVTTTTLTSGTQITNVAFSPIDRSSLLLKWAAGIRFISRSSTTSDAKCGKGDLSLTDDCDRTVADLTIGQDESITGGMLRNLVFKSTVEFHIPKTPAFVILSTSNRFEKNVDLPPLILTPTPISNGSGTPAAGAVIVPSPSVFVLPLKQPNRDFYRIGVGIDLSKVLTKLFNNDAK